MANKLFGLVGFPVKHSLSPLMHNAAFRALGIAAEYKLFEVKPGELNIFLADLDKNGISGLNVTVPYKEKALDFVTLDESSYHLRQVRAVNTMVKSVHGWAGFNTDIPGFQKHLLEQFNPKGKSIAILGAGGGSRAIAYSLAALGAKRIDIFDIEAAKAGSVAAMVAALYPEFDVRVCASVKELDIRNKDLLVNCTPIGMKESDPCLVEEKELHQGLFVYDLIYNPAKTRLLSLAEKSKARTSNGLGMLLYQGAVSFKHFTGIDAPLGIMRDALTEGVSKL